MKIIIAIDSFKGSLTSMEAAQAIQAGILKALPHCHTVLIPMADGGEGMLSIMLEATKGKKQTVSAHNPCMKIIPTEYGISADGRTAFIEMASISGLPLISEKERNPMKTTTIGTGELIRDALNKGCTEFIIGIGGSATNDAGIGMLQALGFRFMDAAGKELGAGGEMMEKVDSIDDASIHPKLRDAHFVVACDVQNPFYGPNGAAHVYARQKGADDDMIATLDKGLRSFAQILQKETGKDIGPIPGSGAAGGMGGGMMALLNAELKSGADLLLDVCHFKERIADASLIITGEGKIDRQSLMGKIPGKILQAGQAEGIPVIALAGCVEDEEALKAAGFESIYAAKPKEMPLEEAIKKDVAMKNIESAAELIIHSIVYK